MSQNTFKGMNAAQAQSINQDIQDLLFFEPKYKETITSVVAKYNERIDLIDGYIAEMRTSLDIHHSNASKSLEINLTEPLQKYKDLDSKIKVATNPDLIAGAKTEASIILSKINTTFDSKLETLKKEDTSSLQYAAGRINGGVSYTLGEIENKKKYILQTLPFQQKTLEKVLDAITQQMSDYAGTHVKTHKELHEKNIRDLENKFLPMKTRPATVSPATPFNTQASATHTGTTKTITRRGLRVAKPGQ